ncbi:MAG: crossover junction endodeoxyribonuclease RuvC [Melioribacteraceae bacterium]|nr:crossover junction endodeoxyribonuclease RuvC [Melioribacteraceae bacterium]MCF8264173.1 crossover junction endodeoxyribonuclease RuvC [Melioribacteraceae bacterium]MCF8412642.1 crossover junction endodeoxyribonuclease RuvC [Melioribacteraceae bacterium]MCF8430513.1 crossover junction endodeoxyribonuclease RuvC [Melioribacteraceae bacterium]
MVILGIDPGTIVTGFGIVYCKGNEIRQLKSGVISLSSNLELPQKLELIYDEIDSLIKIHTPDEFAIETSFYGKNVQSAMKISYARGVSILAAVHNNIPTSEYSPREVKKSVVGRGAATKEQVQFMIRKLLAIREKSIKFDETDALAVAVCHFFKMNSPVKSSGSWKNFIKENPDKVVG